VTAKCAAHARRVLSVTGRHLCTLLTLLLVFTAGYLAPRVPPHIIKAALPHAALEVLWAGAEAHTWRLDVMPPRCGPQSLPLPLPRVHLLLATHGFSDILAHSLPANIKALGEALGSVFLLTKADDAGTLAVASEHGQAGRVVVVASTDLWTLRGAVINKAAAIWHLQELAAASCSGPQDYFAVMDADVQLPPDFGGGGLRALADDAHRHGLNDTLYGLHRAVYATRADLEAGRVTVDMNRARGASLAFLGFFQLYHSSSAHRYGQWSRDAADSDNTFRQLFNRTVLLPGTAVHMGLPGLDWHGRLSQPW
jgi:hypothetical protein